MSLRGVLKLVVLPTLIALVPVLGISVAASAGGFTITAPRPNGSNDTANLQKALDRCVAHGPGCTLHLREGTYLTKQLLANDFSGTIVGEGAAETVIQALPGYVVGPGQVLNSPPSAANPYPFIMSFGGVSDISMSDLSFRVTAYAPTTGWMYHPTGLFSNVTWLKGDVYVQGSVRFTRMSFIGGAGDDWIYPGTPGVNVDNSLLVSGVIPGGAGIGPQTFSLTKCQIVDNGNGFEVAFFSGRATIGGSAGDGNTFLRSSGGVYYQIDGATVEESYNRIGTSTWGGNDITFINANSPTILPTARLMHNSLTTTGGPMTDGIVDIGAGLALTVERNDIQVGGDGTGEGIVPFLTGAGVVIRDNRITGTGLDAIGVYASTSARVVENEVEDFVPTPYQSDTQIYLDPSTSGNLVVCDERTDTVMDQGLGNTLIGCGPSPAEASKALTPAARTVLPRVPSINRPLP